MSSLVETFQHKGHTVEIHYDLDGSASNPRDNCNVGTFVGFRHRDYIIGDEQIDPEDATNTCQTCGGTGRGEKAEDECADCQGEGEKYVRSFEDMVAYIKSEYDVVGDVFPVAMYEHGGVAYSIGTAGASGDRWDTSDAGVIFATAKQVEETGVDLERIPEALKGEIEEYSRWANGEVYGFVIKDLNGDEIEDGSVWGYIGHEWVIEAAKENVPDEQPEVLIPCRLTVKTLDALIDALRIKAVVSRPEPEVLSLMEAIRAKAPMTQTQEGDTDDREA